ncbi:MAG: Fic family protein [bacterium]
MTEYAWSPIEDLPVDWSKLASSELEGLSVVWQEQQARMEQLEGVQQFNVRLRREWSIETGIIENLYSIDRGTTALLIDKGLEASLINHDATDMPADLVVAILRDQEDALEGLFDFICQRRELSTAYIKELHAAMTRHQSSVIGMDGLGRLCEIELIRGEYKKLANNPTRIGDNLVHEYCPAVHVASEMDRLVELHHLHMQEQVPPEVEAAWLHHRFTQIHPFQDGNGRMARILASLVFLRARGFPLLINRDLRDRYITVCEQADAGDLAPMVNLFAEVQKKTFIKVLSISETVLHDREPLQQMLAAVKDRLMTKKVKDEKQKQVVFETAGALVKIANRKLREVAEQLLPSLKAINSDYGDFVDVNDEHNAFWFKGQIIDVAKKYQYYADTRMYSAWVRLKIQETRQVDLVVAFHSLGYEFSGVVAALAYVEYRQHNEDGDVSAEGPYPLAEQAFQFAYSEPTDKVTERFGGWIDQVILAGLDQWRRSL